jgi:hypothetical protein
MLTALFVLKEVNAILIEVTVWRAVLQYPDTQDMRRKARISFAPQCRHCFKRLRVSLKI